MAACTPTCTRMHTHVRSGPEPPEMAACTPTCTDTYVCTHVHVHTHACPRAHTRTPPMSTCTHSRTRAQVLGPGKWLLTEALSSPGPVFVWTLVWTPRTGSLAAHPVGNKKANSVRLAYPHLQPLFSFVAVSLGFYQTGSR